LFSKNFALAPIRLALARCIGRALLCFGDTLENFGDTQMCRDTQFEKHCLNGIILISLYYETSTSSGIMEKERKGEKERAKERKR
jgi:hypothetical protein